MMDGIHLAEQIKRYNRDRFNRGIGLAAAATVMWAGWYGATYAVSWGVFKLMADEGLRYAWWMPHGVAMSLTVLLGLGVFWFLLGPDARINEPEAPGALDQVFAGGKIAASQAVFALLLVIPKVTADSIHALCAVGALTDAELRIGQQVVDMLYHRNDWLPAATFSADPDHRVVERLVAIGILWSRSRHGHGEVRLDPSLIG